MRYVYILKHSIFPFQNAYLKSGAKINLDSLQVFAVYPLTYIYQCINSKADSK